MRHFIRSGWQKLQVALTKSTRPVAMTAFAALATFGGATTHADPADDFHAVRLYLHPPAAAVSPLPTPEVVIDVRGEERQAGGDAFDERRQARAV